MGGRRVTIAQLLAATNVLVLDFDGPICSIFSSLADHIAAGRLRTVLQSAGVALNETVLTTNDPLEVLTFAGVQADQRIVVAVESELVRAEIEAASTAKPTPYADDIIRTAKANGRRVAILSNNSADAINVYLARRDLVASVELVVGRAFGQPGLMKPHPYPASVILAEMAVKANQCLLVGDSITDIQAAKAAGMYHIGFANKTGKYDEMQAAGANQVVTGEDGMGNILSAI
jgi:HAD superfamily hydrolase (TIGR01662 family)